ncbi:Gfo/Idh/MocA family oxidoreductase, partial [bacterium]
GVADAHPEAARSLNEEFGFGAQVYTDYRELLEAERPEVVATALWTPLHLEVFRACAEAGVRAVLSEKPMAPTMEECREMGRIAERTGCQLTFSHQRRFAPGNRLVRSLLKEGRFGSIERVDLYSPPNLLDCGTHTFDQLLSFLGETMPQAVHAAVDTSTTLDWFGVRAEGRAMGTLFFEGFRAVFQIGGPDLDMGSGVRILGSKGMLEVLWDGQLRRCLRYDDPAWRPPAFDEGTQEGQMADMVREVLDCLESGAESEVSWQHALRAAEIIYGAYESARIHERVALPLVGVEGNPLWEMLDEGPVPRLANS